MTTKRPFIVPGAGVILLSVLIIPFLTALIAGKATDWPRRQEDLGTSVIDINYVASSVTGQPNTVQGTAPAGMEVGIYLNDDLLAITKADDKGKFKYPLNVLLPQRVNSLTALPVEIDPSTLLLFYAPAGYQQDRHGVGRPLKDEIQPPFVMLGKVDGQTFQIYGSTEADTTIELCLIPCNGSNANFFSTTDNEGSFSGELQISSKPSSLYSRLRYAGSDEWITFEKPVALVDSSIKRNVQVTVSPAEIQFAFVTDLSAHYKIYQNLVRGGISPLDFVEYVFGKINLNTYLDPRRITWRVEKQAGERVRVFVESGTLEFLIPQDSATTFQIDKWDLSSNIPSYSLQDQIVVNFQNVHLIESSSPPTISVKDKLVWSGALHSTSDPQLTLRVSRNPDPSFDQLAHLRLRQTLANIFEKLPSVNPSPLLRGTLEGSLVGLLPASVPGNARVQIYDYYRDLYLKEPLATTGSGQNNKLQDYLLTLPGGLAGRYENFLFGAMWLIPSLLLLFVVAKLRNASGASLPHIRFIGWLTGILILLSLDWMPLLSQWVLRHGYLTGLLSANIMLILSAAVSISRVKRRGIFSIILPVVSLLLTFGLGFFLFRLPDTVISILLTSLQLLAWGSVVWLAGQVDKEGASLPSISIVLVGVLLAVGLSVPVQSLPLDARLFDNIGILTFAIGTIRPLFPFAVFLALAYALFRNYSGLTSDSLQPAAREFGRVIFTTFVVGLTPSWSFVPVSVLIAVVFFEWILPPKPITDSEKDKVFLKKFRKKAIEDLLRLNKASRLRRTIEASLQKQLRDGKQIKDYNDQQNEYNDEIAKITRPAYLKGYNAELTVRDVPFNYGAASLERWENAKHAMTWGVLFLIPLLLISVVPLALGKLDDVLPYPFLSVLARLGLLAVEFMASALFLGFFFPYLRGRNGLEKAAWLAGISILCLLPVHLLAFRTLADVLALVIWAGSILAYNLLIGALAFDLRTLSEYGFQWDRLPDLYNLRDLTFYLTGSGAPLVATVISAVGGNLNDLLPALVRVVFPNLTLGGPQSELLKLLLDLVSRIAGKFVE